MEVLLENTGRRYNREWIFRGIDRTFPAGSRTAVLGANGSGKSTLLRMIAGALLPSEGKVVHRNNTGVIKQDLVYQHVSLTAPYITLPEMFTAAELVKIHHGFRPLAIAPADLPEAAQLDHAANKKIAVFSSGMKQRLRIALAVFSRSDILLIDEPHSNLDAAGMIWYRQILENQLGGRTLFVCSNHQPAEYFCCEDVVDIHDYK